IGRCEDDLIPAPAAPTMRTPSESQRRECKWRKRRFMGVVGAPFIKHVAHCYSRIRLLRQRQTTIARYCSIRRQTLSAPNDLAAKARTAGNVNTCQESKFEVFSGVGFQLNGTRMARITTNRVAVRFAAIRLFRVIRVPGVLVRLAKTSSIPTPTNDGLCCS